jgi:hypothetical protein
MTDKVQCSIHGNCEATFLCHHLTRDSVGLGFNRNDPTDDDRFPDAWCDDCEIIREAHDGWNEESEKLTKIVLVCSGCYNQARIRNTRTDTTLDDLQSLRWKCGSCDEWHSGPCLDFGYDSPYYWSKEHDNHQKRAKLLPEWLKRRRKTFLTSDYCVIENENFFFRGVIHLPIIGTSDTFRWGVWGSLSRENFELLFAMDDDPKCVELPPMFSWLSNSIPEYPESLSLKMYAHIQPLNDRPKFELEHTDHPLAQEYHHGISPERVKEIMFRRLKAFE